MVDPVAGDLFNPYNPAQHHAELVRWQLDPEEEFRRLEHFMRGERWDEETHKWSIKGKRLLNEKGIQEVMVHLQLAHKGIILSEYAEEKVNRILLELANNITKMIYLRWQDYNVDRADFNVIRSLVIRNIQAAYNRAINAGERRHLGQVSRRVEQIISNDTGQQRPRRFNFFGLGG